MRFYSHILDNSWSILICLTEWNIGPPLLVIAASNFNYSTLIYQYDSILSKAINTVSLLYAKKRSLFRDNQCPTYSMSLCFINRLINNKVVNIKFIVLQDVTSWNLVPTYLSARCHILQWHNINRILPLPWTLNVLKMSA